MSERSKFENLTAIEIQDRMYHHQTEVWRIVMSPDQNMRVAQAHSGWFKRLDELHFRKFGIHGRNALATKDFADRHGLEFQYAFLTY